MQQIQMQTQTHMLMHLATQRGTKDLLFTYGFHYFDQSARRFNRKMRKDNENNASNNKNIEI